MRPTDDELAGRIDQVSGVLGQHVFRQHLLDDLLDAELFNVRVSRAIGVLGGDHNVDDASRAAIDILDGDLRLGIRTEPFRELASLADAGQFATEAVRIHDWRRHQLGRLIAGIAKHDSLVTGTLLGMLFPFRLFRVHALGDVRGLGGEVVVDEK